MCKMIDSSASQIEVIERQVSLPARSKTSSQNQPLQLHGSYYMADTISISTKHGIKSYAGDIKLCDTCSYIANATLKKVNQLTGDECLWTGESVHCICTHHVEQHCTVRDKCGLAIAVHCHGAFENNEQCHCRRYIPKSIRIDSCYFDNNEHEIITEDYIHV